MELATADPATPMTRTRPAPGVLPLRFRVPASWPEPSPDWVAANQGWTPPLGWTPVVGLLEAPRGWSFWERDAVGWERLAGPHRTQAVRGIVVGAIVFLVGVLLLTLHSDRDGALAVLFWGATLFGPIDLARNAGDLIRTPQSVLRTARATAARVGADIDELAYAEIPAGERPGADEFVARRVVEAWSFDGTWPASQRHAVSFEVRETRLSRGRRIGTMVLAGAAAALLIFVLAWSATAGGRGSGALTPTAERPPAHAQL
ncbi:hypothetical protein EDF46_1546 [Frondihabitans sp. PhB188]|uniref:hypothetical protein n=1 Tax=Frondihabitans sp. PhB188 TaxID=2485200 RepID=UPI000F4770EE|nr:hypothetical protein [Frondihabitans sp. PhB188]ROQ39911.1 hypothetical protein EDF46_1546 [Frondihabitans sp. PhB188]